MRREVDSIGTVEVPEEAYWGVHTARAMENFPISGTSVSQHPQLICGYAMVKQAAARANRDLGVLDAERAGMIETACQRVIAGEHHDQFPVDVVQGGAGTSTNMNVNEVLTNIALEAAGRAKGDYSYLSPLDHTNKSQSTNDTYPTAVKIALLLAAAPLLEELAALGAAFEDKALELGDMLKVGRTQLQDAVPMTLGQEFAGFATTLRGDRDRLREAIAQLREVNLGGTAIGTGISAPDGYTAAVLEHLRTVSDLDLAGAADLVSATSDTGPFLTLSAALKRAAVSLSKISNDLRLLSSGPQAGLGEISLPARQAGSSIMPGKVNPVIPEVVSQVAYAVAGADTTVTMAVESGQLQLNAFEPIIAHSLLQASGWVQHAAWTLRVHCVTGIEANSARLERMVAASVGVVTALIPDIGYAAATTIAKTALASGSDVADLVVDSGLLSREQVQRRLVPAGLAGGAEPENVKKDRAPVPGS